MRTLSTEKGKANTAIPVRKEESAVRFSASSTWMSLKTTVSGVGGPFVSLFISYTEFGNDFATRRKSSSRISMSRKVVR